MHLMSTRNGRPRNGSPATPAPADLRPMLATPSDALPTSGEWAYEMKWDGVRALALVDGTGVRLTSRNGNDVSVAYPEIQPLGEHLALDALLDGEIVAVDDDGRASFQRLQARMHLRDPIAIREIAAQVPVAYVLFDVLWLDGHLVTDLEYRERRRLLEGLELRGSSWQTPSASDDGEHAFEISRQLGFEGVVAKRVDSRYEPGRRSPAWRKLKHQREQEFVVGGWVSGLGSRENRIGALLIGYYDDDGALHWAGRVGTGFTEAELDRLAGLLAPIARPDSPFTDRGLPRDARYVEPELVAQVRFTEWTDSGRVRHPAYLGLRDDKPALDVRRE
jgi:bifunctional non-homologous end joining protein LigD